MRVLYLSLQTLVPAVDWMPYLAALFAPVSLNESEPVVVYAKEYLQKVSDLIDRTNKRSDICLMPIMVVFCHVQVYSRIYTKYYTHLNPKVLK